MNEIARRLSENKSTVRQAFEPFLDRAGDLHLAENPDWSVRDVLAHLTAAETGMRRMIEIMVAKGGYHFKPYNRDQLNTQRIAEMEAHSAADLLAAWEAGRDQTIALADRLTAEQLAYSGSDHYWGEITTQTIFETAIRHTNTHAGEVRRLQNVTS
ncbi:MAG: DinB family protein [Ardenticatenaceae bacterium]|nr:DinB family protein [Ardenticatenaceae bacterium]